MALFEIQFLSRGFFSAWQCPGYLVYTEQSKIKSNVKLDGFRSRLRASYVSSHIEEF